MSDNRQLIVLDPGHGGTADIGGSTANRAVGPNGLLEKDLTLDLAGRVRDRLAGNGVHVALTRDSDTNPTIGERVAVAKRQRAPVFLSLHFNADPSPAKRGTIAYIGRGAGPQARALADALAESVSAALSIPSEVRTRNLSPINPAKHTAETAAVLLETAYLTNPETARSLEDPATRDRLADAIAGALRQARRPAAAAVQSLQRQSRALRAATEIPLEPAGGGGMSIDERALEIGDIIVSTTADRVSEVIREVTDSRVSHAALYVGDGMVVEAIGAGVRLQTLEDALADDLYAVALRYPGLSEEQRLRVRDFAGEQIGEKYDFRGIAMHALYRVGAQVCDRMSGIGRALCDTARWEVAFGNDDSERWFCSELIFAAFEAAGRPLGTRPAESTPADLLQLDPPLAYVGHLKAVEVPAESQGHRPFGLPVHALAADCTADVKLRLFIPAPAVGFETGSLQVGQAFGGDGRSFSYSGGTSRAEIHAEVGIPSGAGQPTVNVLRRAWGQSTEYDVADVDFIHGRPIWWLEKRAGATPIRRLTLGVSDDNLNIGAERDGAATKVTLTVAGNLPLMPSSPDIDADLDLYLKVQGGRLMARLEGDHDGFPAYELYVDRTLIYSHDPVATQQTPLSLLPPKDFDVDTAWIDVGPATCRSATPQTLGGLPLGPARAGGTPPPMLAGQILPAVRPQQAAEAVIAGLELGLNAVSTVTGNTSDISWDLEYLTGSYHPFHETFSNEEKIRFGRGGYTLYDGGTVSAGIVNGLFDEISAKAEFSFEANGSYIQNVFVREPTVNDAFGWDLRLTSRVRRHARVFQEGSLTQIARVDLIFTWQFSNFLEMITKCERSVRIYANGDVEFRSVWDDSAFQRELNAARDRVSGEPQPVSQSLAIADLSQEEKERATLWERDPPAPETGWTRIKATAIGSAMGPELPAAGPALVASLADHGRPISIGGLPVYADRRPGSRQRATGPAATMGNLALATAPGAMTLPDMGRARGAARPLHVVRPLERSFIVADPRRGMSVARRTFDAPTGDLSGVTRLKVSVPHLPAGGSIRWHIPQVDHRARVTFFTGGRTSASASGGEVTLRSLDGGIAHVDCAVKNAAGTTVESNKYIVSSPEFVIVFIDGSVDRWLRDRQLDGRKDVILDEMMRTIRHLYADMNVRFVLHPDDSLPAHLVMRRVAGWPYPVQPVPAAAIVEVSTDPALVDPETGRVFGQRQAGRHHAPGDFPAADPRTAYSVARSLPHHLRNFAHLSDLAAIDDDLTTMSLPDADMDQIAVMFGRMMGENAAHESGHFIINAFRGHVAGGDSGLMREFTARTFNDRTGMEVGGAGDPLLIDRGVGAVNGFGTARRREIIAHIPTDPPLDIAAQRAATKSLEAHATREEERVSGQLQQTEILNQTRAYEDPSNFPVNLPEIGSGEDRFEVSVPEGQKFALVDVEYLEQSPLAKAEVIARPDRGSTGTLSIVVRWSHPPYGKIKYRIRAFASPSGRAAPIRVRESDSGFNDRSRLLIDQDADLEMLVTGARAKMLYDAVQKAQRERPRTQPSEPTTMIIAGVAIVVIIAAVVMLGFMVLYAILTQALDKGYDVKDTKYKAVTGEGESRQEHEMLFNLTRPQ